MLPVLDGAAILPHCLAALSRSTFTDFEIVTIDDGSTDATAELLAAARVDVLIRNPRPAGCFAARNQGAKAARGSVLVFIDADIEVAPDTLARAWRHCGEESADAVIGLYALEHPHRNLASRYKNAWIRWSYLRHAGEVDWFFTAIGAVRRELWESVGGFRETFERTTGGGDLDFGQRLRSAGATIRMDKDLAVVHRRRFSVWSLLANDFNRARGWAALGLSRRGLATSARAGLANVSGGFVASVASAGLVVLCVAIALLRPQAWPLALAAVALYLVGIREFLGWAAANVSPGFAARSAALQLLDHLACGFGVVTALAERFSRR